MPRFASTTAHSIPAGPAPTTSTSLSAFVARVKRSGCHPRRNSSPEVAFCVQTIGRERSQREMQMLQPMHSRISSIRPSSIFLGRKGSAIEGRAAPITSSSPSVIAFAIVSGLVNRPTPTTGFFVTALTARCHSAWEFSGKKREGPASSPQFMPSVIVMSQRST